MPVELTLLSACSSYRVRSNTKLPDRKSEKAERPEAIIVLHLAINSMKPTEISNHDDVSRGSKILIE